MRPGPDAPPAPTTVPRAISHGLPTLERKSSVWAPGLSQRRVVAGGRRVELRIERPKRTMSRREEYIWPEAAEMPEERSQPELEMLVGRMPREVVGKVGGKELRVIFRGAKMREERISERVLLVRPSMARPRRPKPSAWYGVSMESEADRSRGIFTHRCCKPECCQGGWWLIGFGCRRRGTL